MSSNSEQDNLNDNLNADMNTDLNDIDILDDLNDDEKIDILKRAKEQLKTNYPDDVDDIVYDDPNFLKINGQNYALIAYVGKDFKAKTEVPGFKILGAFNEIDDAIKHLDLLKEDPYEKYFDIFFVELYKFMPSIPFLDKNMTQQKVDKFLYDIIIRNKLKANIDKEAFELRKYKLTTKKGTTVSRNKIDEPVDEAFKKANEEKNKEYATVPDKLPRDNTHKRLLEKLQNRGKLNTKKLELLKSEIHIKGQNYAVVTMIKDPIVDDELFVNEFKNEFKNDTDRMIIKIHGVFNSEEEAKEHCKTVINFTDEFHVSVISLYEWGAALPDLESVQNSEYNDSTLNKLYKTHTSEAKAGQMYAQHNAKELLNTAPINHQNSISLGSANSSNICSANSSTIDNEPVEVSENINKGALAQMNSF